MFLAEFEQAANADLVGKTTKKWRESGGKWDKNQEKS